MGGPSDPAFRTCLAASKETNSLNIQPQLIFYVCLQFFDATFNEDNGYVVMRNFFSATIEMCFLGIVLKIVLIFFLTSYLVQKSQSLLTLANQKQAEKLKSRNFKDEG